MYKVFVKESVINLSLTAKVSEDFISLPIVNANFQEIIATLQENPALKYNLYHETEELLFQVLLTKLPVVVACGGKVYNRNKRVLFIKRDGKWDLPKGKIEQGEELATCAIREVEEETGIQDLEISRFLKRTFHVYKRNDVWYLKLTYWFEMFSSYTGELTPQQEEGITKAKWKDFKRSRKALKNTYGAIRELFPLEYNV